MGDLGLNLQQMKIAYIAHPVSGDIAGNIEKIKQIVRNINLTEPDTVPFVPYYSDLHALNDNVPEERKRGIENNTALFKAGVIDEIRLYGDFISAGMAQECLLAAENGITIKPMNNLTRRDFIIKLENNFNGVVKMKKSYLFFVENVWH